MPRFFTGDLSTGDLTQWRIINSSGAAGRADGDYAYLPSATVYPKGRGDGSVEVLSDPDCGYFVKLKLTEDDNYALGGDSDWGVGTQKAQMDASNVGARFEQGDTVWVAWSQKFVEFDAWPDGRVSSNFLITNEFHGNSGPLPGGASIFWGMPYWSGPINAQVAGTPEGYWSLCVDKYTEYTNPDTIFVRELLLNVPINLGNWIDVKMEFKLDTEANGGFIRCWINNERQTFISGGQTWYGQVTAPFSPAGEWQYYASTLYRSGDGNAVFPWTDMEVHVANVRSADSEASL